MIFFTGMDDLHHAAKVRAAFISVHRLERRKSSTFPVRRWVMDSGSFTTITKHGGYPSPVEQYAEQIRKFSKNGRLMAAVTQDYMCEPHMLKRTGFTVADHQRLTIERYNDLMACDTAGVRIMPVLQGYAPSDYVDHIRAYGHRLAHRAWVGVGSICKRNSNPHAVCAVLLAIKKERPDLRLHAFGVKITALSLQLTRDLIFSADSTAWSFAARYEGRKAHDPQEAIRYGKKVSTMAVQLHLGMEIA